MGPDPSIERSLRSPRQIEKALAFCLTFINSLDSLTLEELLDFAARKQDARDTRAAGFLPSQAFLAH